MSRFVVLFLLASYAIADCTPWLPPVRVYDAHPRAFFAREDSARIAEKMHTAPFDDYYRTIYATALGFADNTTQENDFARSRIAFAAAFVIFFGVDCDFLPLPDSARAALALKCSTYIAEMRTDMGFAYVNTNYHYPCQRLIQYALAYDIATSRFSISPERITLLATTIYNNATRNISGTYPMDDITLFLNHKLIVAGALGTVACVLPEEGELWINYAMTKTEAVIFDAEHTAGADDGFAEGPHYFAYSWEHLAPFFIAMQRFTGDFTAAYTDACGGVDDALVRTQFFDERYGEIYRWMAQIRLWDDTYPPLEDSFCGKTLPFTAYFAQSDPSLACAVVPDGSRILLHPYVVAAPDMPEEIAPARFVFMPTAGNAIFRAVDHHIYFHLFAENGRAAEIAHDHSDAASFMLYAGQQALALDPGYINWYEHERVNSANEHNVILVDGVAPEPTSPMPAFLKNGINLRNYMSATATVEYSGAEIERECMLVANMFLVVRDRIYSIAPHEYTFLCHGNAHASTGGFAQNACGARWQVCDTMALDVGFAAPDMSLDTVTAVHELGYGIWAEHTVLRAHFAGDTVASIAMLHPAFRNDTLFCESISAATFSALNCYTKRYYTGIAIAPAREKLFVTLHDTTHNFAANASFAMRSIVDGGMLQVFVAENCDSFFCDNQLFFAFDTACNFVAQSFEEDSLFIWVDSTITVKIVSDIPPLHVSNADSFTYHDGLITIFLHAKNECAVYFDPARIDEQKYFAKTATLEITPNPFTCIATIYVEAPYVSPSDGYIRIVGMDGRTLAHENARNFTWHPTREIATGIYFAQFIVGKKVICQRKLFFIR